MTEFVILQRLFSSDLRMLGCRRAASSSCARVSVRANGTRYLLCPLRVEAFLSPSSEGVSLNGLECEL